MQLKKHNSKTPPERKPKWLRKGIALLAAVATLATGGIVASTAYAGGGGGKHFFPQPHLHSSVSFLLQNICFSIIAQIFSQYK